MILEIFPLIPVEWEGQFMLDLTRRVAVVEFDAEAGRGRLQVGDPDYKEKLERVFFQPCFTFVAAAGEGPGHGDATATYPAWSQEALQVILRDKLTELNLGVRQALNQGVST